MPVSCLYYRKVRDLEGRKSELMQALRELTSERENMHYDLEDANRRILLLERNVRELESQVRKTLSDYEEKILKGSPSHQHRIINLYYKM